MSATFTLLISTDGPQCRIALLQNPADTTQNYRVVEYRDESADPSGGDVAVGNIYKGRVTQLQRGLSAAFIDIGQTRAAYMLVDTDPHGKPQLHEGQKILVQINRPAIGTKGCRVTQQLSLAGQAIVLLVNQHQTSVSRRITDEAERTRLTALLESICPADHGLIARTGAQGQSAPQLQNELHKLLQQYAALVTTAEGCATPTLIYAEPTLAIRTVRDLSNAQLSRIVVDEQATYQAVVDVLSLDTRVELHTQQTPLFDYFNIESALGRARHRQIYLKSGAYLVFDHHEALTSVDVNSGANVGKQSLTETALSVNLEAATEIATQLRLRNIGGLIVVDFIDMNDATYRQQVSERFAQALQADRARCHVLPISELGLLQMTRQRIGDSWVTTGHTPCPHCHGHGTIRSVHDICLQLLRDLRRDIPTKRALCWQIYGHPTVITGLGDARHISYLTHLKSRFAIDIAMHAAHDFQIEQYTFRAKFDA